LFTLDDGGTYKANEQQRWIWRKWRGYWQQVAEARAAHDARLVVILNGELADDNYHATTQLVTRNPADMMRLAIECLTPMLELQPNAIYVTRGTEAHSGVSGWLDEKIADDIGARAAKAGTASHWPVSYNHLTLPTILSVYLTVGAKTIQKTNQTTTTA